MRPWRYRRWKKASSNTFGTGGVVLASQFAQAAPCCVGGRSKAALNRERDHDKSATFGTGGRWPILDTTAVGLRTLRLR